jgi:mannose-6-phosphate isomerase-like protein (cupin superfamily)
MNPLIRPARLRRVLPYAVAVGLGLGWAAREVTFATEQANEVKSQTLTLRDVKMAPYEYDGTPCGQIGHYLQGDTPGSRKFDTGRFVLDAGKSPHPPHVHPEEEVMIVESGHGEILCDGKTTKIGPGSVMYSVPNAPHAITNTGDEPIVFYFIKWEARNAK